MDNRGEGYTLCEVTDVAGEASEAVDVRPVAGPVGRQPFEVIWITFSRRARVASIIRPGFLVCFLSLRDLVSTFPHYFVAQKQPLRS